MLYETQATINRLDEELGQANEKAKSLGAHDVATEDNASSSGTIGPATPSKSKCKHNDEVPTPSRQSSRQTKAKRFEM
ncbi:hypothetical protein H257_05551 [Aphanomyces astaci]|uniref:Uncharacterized protein n=1 Tax=Aphanomyces astaci TaxID=112090 RepID=W4GRR3_APHAT|nr:hypothetical protein H257_05551 [Aphanomyces astaci]ETV82026.1 hypothetical protein H257_05551 [Aphanomyces astaci]|eukprot:XP_009828763.1 hypothetical protein H257_05551 [Aphanomyces astaci]